MGFQLSYRFFKQNVFVSSCLSKIEELLASLKFKEYNSRVRKAREELMKKTGEAISNSQLNKDLAKIPYGSECGELWRSPDVDVKMIDMLDTYWKLQEQGGKHKKSRFWWDQVLVYL